MNKALKSLTAIGLVLFFGIFFASEARAEVAAPKITKLTGTQNFLISGTATANANVLIYLDGNFAGYALNRSGAGSAEPGFEFAYSGEKKLADGAHAVMAVAQDKTSLVLSGPSVEIKFTINELPAPTLITPNKKTIASASGLAIAGLAKSGSAVKIYIDDQLDGRTEILQHESGTANFSYRPAKNLSLGRHQLYAFAQDSAGKLSAKSEIVDFIIELPMPAPTILKPVVNRASSASRPFIVGLAKNNSKIKIYIDKKYSGEFTVKNDLSGTANFAYRPSAALVRGSHAVYAIAIDRRGKASILSNSVNFNIRTAAIAQSAKEQNSNAVAKIGEPKAASVSKTAATVISKSTGAVEADRIPEKNNKVLGEKTAAEKLNQQEDFDKIKDLIASGTAQSETKIGGMVNEDRGSQSKLKLSLALFVLFLVGVVGWLLWINRELIKERQAQAEAESDDKRDKLL